MKPIRLKHYLAPNDRNFDTTITIRTCDTDHLLLTVDRPIIDTDRKGIVKLRNALSKFLAETKPQEKKPKIYSGKAMYISLNAQCAAPAQTAGFWREHSTGSGRGKLPFPVAMHLETFDLQLFLVMLAAVESKAKKNHCKGCSTHRWDGSQNGSIDFQFNGWKWPSGYATYIQQGVLPSAAFYKFVMGHTLAGLPPF